ATAVGATIDTQVGIATEKVRVNKPLMIRLQMPRAFTQTDESRFTAVLHNSTDTAMTVEVACVASGVTLKGDAKKTITLEPGKPTAVEWPIVVDSATDATIRVTAVAKNNGPTDGVEETVPIVPHGKLAVTYLSGDVKTEAKLHVVKDPRIIAGESSLTLGLAPTPAASLLAPLDYLADYPYGCTEQTMSRFLPTVVVMDTFRRLNLGTPRRAAQIPDMLDQSFARLKKFQHQDGGWGWWEWDETDPFMTAYVLEGYARAEEAGIAVPEDSRERGLGSARTQLEQTNDTSYWPSERLFLVRALALNGEAPSETWRPWLAPAKLTTPGQLANGLLITHTLGAGWQSERDQILTKLVGLAKREGDQVFWETDEYWGVEETGQALLAIATTDPSNALLPGVLRWLQHHQRGHSYYSTRDTAIAILGLSRYLANLRIDEAPYDFTITLNGAPYQTFHYEPGMSLTEEPSFTVPLDQLKDGENEIALAQTGGVPCGYALDFQQIIAADHIAAEAPVKGFTVTREYYKLTTQRLEDGTIHLAPSKEPLKEVQAGDFVRCRLTIHSDKEREFVMITDPLPAGCEVVERTEPEDPWSWNYWWSHTDLRDDRIIYFSRWLPEGESTIAYTLRAEAPGTYHLLPARLEAMYNPDEYATSEELTIGVRP
ncbi:MAG: alpha-2-macroglobulin family protein, partial [bacterium]